MTSDDLVRRRARHLAAQAAASDDPLGLFETLYAEARAGRAAVPWDADQPKLLTTRTRPPKLRLRAEFTRG